MGVNAAVIGILISALYTPIWTSSILQAVDFTRHIVCYVGVFPFAVVIVVTGTRRNINRITVI